MGEKRSLRDRLTDTGTEGKVLKIGMTSDMLIATEASRVRLAYRNVASVSGQF